MIRTRTISPTMFAHFTHCYYCLALVPTHKATQPFGGFLFNIAKKPRRHASKKLFLQRQEQVSSSRRRMDCSVVYYEEDILVVAVRQQEVLCTLMFPVLASKGRAIPMQSVCCGRLAKRGSSFDASCCTARKTEGPPATTTSVSRYCVLSMFFF